MTTTRIRGSSTAASPPWPRDWRIRRREGSRAPPFTKAPVIAALPTIIRTRSGRGLVSRIRSQPRPCSVAAPASPMTAPPRRLPEPVAPPANNFTAPGFGDPAMTLSGGVPQAYVLPWPNPSAGAYPNPNFPAALNGITSVVDQNAGRPARQVQWSVGLQREIISDLVVDVAYVGNRGAWWLSTVLDNYNAVTPQNLSAAGLDIN